jgi:hypothetical protein
MSDLQKVLDRVQIDYDFYLAILANPNAALGQFSLTQSERTALTGDNRALWNLISRLPVENGGPGPPPPGPPPPGPPPPGPPPPGPPPPGPPPPGPPPPGPPPPGPPGIGVGPVVPGPPPPGPPPGGPGGIGVGPGGVGVGPVPGGTPPPIGVIGVIHFDGGTIHTFEDVIAEQIVNDPIVIGAISAIQNASTFGARVDAIVKLMERLE